MSFDTLEFLREAIQILSENGVAEIREFIEKNLQAEGAEPEIDNAGNIIASKGGGKNHLVLNTHMDTVPPHIDFSEDEDKISGRGACDAKGSLAAMMAAFLNSDLQGRLTLAITPDEETTSKGANHLVNKEGFNPDAVIVGEPTGLDICNSSRGRFAGIIEIEGSAALASQPESGLNAIKAVNKVNKTLEEFDKSKEHPELGAPELQPTLIQGGEAKNIVPEKVEVTFDRRSLPGEKATEFMQELEKRLKNRLKQYNVAVKPKSRETPFPEEFETDRDSDIVSAMSDTAANE